MGFLAVGIDDTATATQKSEGWAFIGLADSGVGQLQVAANSVAGTNTFHASRCGKSNINKYERFLEAIRNVVSANSPSFLAHVFDDPSWHSDLKTIAVSIAGLPQVNLVPRVRGAIWSVMPPLITFQRISASQQLGTVETKVWLDESGSTQGFASMTVGTAPPISAVAFTRALYNGYRTQKFPAAPQMSTNGFHVVPDDRSILIQAADVFGNFAAAYAAWKLGATRGRQLKGEAFARVFNNPDIGQVLPSLSLQGQHLEVTLPGQGALQLVIA
jgi:hypothetical protein